jgi:hypothetical protein
LKEYKHDATKSPMLSYKEKLSPAELDDLLAFLVSLKEIK